MVLGLILLLVVVSTHLWHWFYLDPYDLKRWLMLLTVFPVFVLSPWVGSPSKTTINLAVLGIALFFFSSIFTLLLHERWQDYNVYVVNHLILALYVWSFSRVGLVLSKRELQSWLFAIAAVFIVLASLRAGIRLTYLDENWSNFYSLRVGFNNPRFLNQVQVWLTPFLCFWLLDSARNMADKFVSILILSLSFSLLLLTEARGAIVASVCSFLTLMFFLRGNNRRVLALGLIASVLCALLIFWLVTMFSGILEADELVVGSIERASNGRLLMWSETWPRVFDNPLFGHGFGYWSTYPFITHTNAHVHNFPLELLYGVGFVGTLGLAIALGCVALSSIKRAHHAQNIENVLNLALLSSLVGGLVLSLVSGVYMTPLSQLFGTLTVGLLVSETAKSKRNVPIAIPIPFKVVMFAVIILLSNHMSGNRVNPNTGKQYIGLWVGTEPKEYWPGRLF